MIIRVASQYCMILDRFSDNGNEKKLETYHRKDLSPYNCQFRSSFALISLKFSDCRWSQKKSFTNKINAEIENINHV